VSLQYVILERSEKGATTRAAHTSVFAAGCRNEEEGLGQGMSGIRNREQNQKRYERTQ
jgi:hypothetical protein